MLEKPLGARLARSTDRAIIESLEGRQFFAADPLAISVNFQPASSVTPDGFVADTGQNFADRGNGFSYGWNADNTLYARERTDPAPAPQYDTHEDMYRSATKWEISLPNGTYTVHVVAGDPTKTSVNDYRIAAEGVRILKGTPSVANPWVEGTADVVVADGRLTLTNASGAVNNRICFVEIKSTDGTPTPTPTPTATSLHWSRIADAPLGRSEANGAAVNGKLYVLGGYTDSTYKPTRRCDAYDPATNSWTRIADLPVGLTNAGVAVDGQYIYLAGGYPEGTGGHAQSFSTTAVYRYDTVANAWSTIKSLPKARGSGSLVLLGRSLHYFGGSDSSRNDVATHWSLNLDDPSATWKTETSMTNSRNHIGTIVLDGRIYAMGGQNGQDHAAVVSTRCDVFDPAANNGAGAWSRIANLGLARSHLADSTIAVDGKIIVMGGEGPNDTKIANVTSYDPLADKWTELPPLPAGRKMGVGGLIDGKIYFATGGNSGFNKTSWVGEFK